MSRLYAWFFAVFAFAEMAEGQPRKRPDLPIAFGNASWYGWIFQGRLTADGRRFQAMSDSAASLMLPLGTWVRITNLTNDRSVVVQITDRGPFVRGRIIDVSLGTAIKLDMVRAGIVRVRVDPLPGHPSK